MTSVGRRNLEQVAWWCAEKRFSAPVLLAENLPEPVEYFPVQIPIVVDRICSRVDKYQDHPAVIAEEYYKIIVLDHPVTHQLGAIKGVELLEYREEVERKRKQKLFTVNTAHVIAALFGEGLGCTFVEEAVTKEEVAKTILLAISEVAPWLGFDREEAERRANQIIKRFGSPLQDPVYRILGPSNCVSALQYIQVPLDALRSLGAESPTLEEARALLTS